MPEKPQKPKTEADTTCPICGEEWFYCDHQIWDVKEKCRREGAKAERERILEMVEKQRENFRICEDEEEVGWKYALDWLKAEMEK